MYIMIYVSDPHTEPERLVTKGRGEIGAGPNSRIEQTPDRARCTALLVGRDRSRPTRRVHGKTRSRACDDRRRGDAQNINYRSVTDGGKSHRVIFPCLRACPLPCPSETLAPACWGGGVHLGVQTIEPSRMKLRERRGRGTAAVSAAESIHCQCHGRRACQSARSSSMGRTMRCG